MSAMNDEFSPMEKAVARQFIKAWVGMMAVFCLAVLGLLFLYGRYC